MASRASRKFSTLEVAGDWKPITGMALLCTQVLALTKKNIIVRYAWIFQFAYLILAFLSTALLKSV